jgi:uncharacterized Zn finger protein (UPF0148 family)
MELSHGLGIEKKLSLQKEIAMRIGRYLGHILGIQKTLDLTIEKGLDQGTFKYPWDGTRCPNCGRLVFGDVCPNCNQHLNEPELLDHDPEAEDREGEDLSDSEDADDADESAEEQEEKASGQTRIVGFRECLEAGLRDCGVKEEDLLLFLYLITEVAGLEKPIPANLPESVAIRAAKVFGVETSTVQKTWQERPFDDEELKAIVEECLLESSREAGIPAQPSILLEIRKKGDEYVPLVNDRYQDLVLNTAAKNKWIPVGPSGQKFSGKLVLQKKEQTREILYKILETIIACRRDFLDAPNREAALEVLRTRPFQQKEVVDRHGIDKAIIHRHFNDKPILTPHGLFILKELSQQEALEQEDMTVPGLHDVIRTVIEQTDREEKFLSDQQIANYLVEQGTKLSREYVTKIRKQLKIPNSADRKKAARSQQPAT